MFSIQLERLSKLYPLYTSVSHASTSFRIFYICKTTLPSSTHVSSFAHLDAPQQNDPSLLCDDMPPVLPPHHLLPRDPASDSRRILEWDFVPTGHFVSPNPTVIPQQTDSSSSQSRTPPSRSLETQSQRHQHYPNLPQMENTPHPNQRGRLSRRSRRSSRRCPRFCRRSAG